MGKKVTATQIEIALSKTHKDDFFITECKNGSTSLPPEQGLLKFDAVSVRKSYSKPCIKIYEVKVSRSDFARDNKWNLYMQYCNEFYFACPAGLIKKEELPIEVGLIWYYPETDKVVTKRKAVKRKLEADMTDMYRYILYSRLDPDRIPFFNDRAEYAMAYLADKANKQYVGRNLGSKLAIDLECAQKEIQHLSGNKRRLDLLEEIGKILIKNEVIESYEWIRDYGSEREKKSADEYLLRRIKERTAHSYPEDFYSIARTVEVLNNRFQKLIKQDREGKEGE